MKYTTLPQTNLKVSKICLGTMTFGRQNTEADGHEQMSYAFDQGVNFFDTAEIYAVPVTPDTTGATEEIIGSWFKKTGLREQIVLASKIVGPGEYTKHVRNNGYAPEAIREAVEGSLQRLQTDYIDLYQLHWPVRKANFFGERGYNFLPDNDPWKDDFNQVLKTLKDLIREGKIRHIGLSNETAWGVMRCIEEHRHQELPPMITIQNPYSLLNRTFEEALSEICLRENLGLLAYSPLAFGMLTGKYMNGQQPQNSRLTLFPNFSRYSSNSCVKATRAYKDIADKYKLSLTQMSLAFVNSRPFLTSNIIGATTLEQLKENVESIQVDLSDELLEDIRNVHLEMPNPAC